MHDEHSETSDPAVGSTRLLAVAGPSLGLGTCNNCGDFRALYEWMERGKLIHICEPCLEKANSMFGPKSPAGQVGHRDWVLA